MPGAPRDGIPHPNRWGLHRSLGGPQDQGTFADGAALETAVPVAIVVVLAGAAAWRLRFKATVGGTLAFAYLRPNRAGTAYATSNPGDVAVLANTEVAVEVAQHFGESRLQITYTPSGNGTVTHADISEV